jgi:hypothetical protein
MRFVSDGDEGAKTGKTDQKVEANALESTNTYGEVEVIWYHGLLSQQKHADVSGSDGGKGEQGARARVGPTHRQMGEVTAEDARDVMCRVVFLLPIE